MIHYYGPKPAGYTHTYFRRVVLNYSSLLQSLYIISERINSLNGSDSFSSSLCFIDENRSARKDLLPKQ